MWSCSRGFPRCATESCPREVVANLEVKGERICLQPAWVICFVGTICKGCHWCGPVIPTDSPHGNSFFFSFLFIEQLPRCTNQIFLCAIQVNFLGSIVVSISACHAEDRGSIPRRGDVIFFSPPFLDKWREITRLVCSPPPLPLPPPIEKTLSFPPLFTAIHKWMPLCLKAWLSLSNKKAASAGNRTRAARALL